MKVILSIDGGGVRGIMEAMILKRIEMQLRVQTKKNVHLAEYVDVISGASTGGIISAILTAPNESGGYKYDCYDAVNFYDKHCYEIFNKSKRILGELNYKYCEKNLEKYLDKYFGSISMKDLKNHVIIPTVNINTCQGLFFSNIKADEDQTNYKVKDVLRCTSAAPTYFKPKKVGNIIGIDGGMVANNMSICAISKLQKYNDTELKDICVINISSGSVKPELKGFDTNWGILKWATNITNIMLYANVGLVKYQLSQLDLGGLFEIDIPQKYRYYSEDMADASEQNMLYLKHAAQCTIIENDKFFREVCDFLIRNKK
ncbi:MAG: patatin-like phospholipase family protein [Bacteroidales bacterium]|jgi:patatin-like phospholipase/acyl hydrolase|nr:patatin-like phospholipase family protein [Bacteroidales bacterium]